MAVCGVARAGDAPASEYYQLKSAVALLGKSPAWDYVVLGPRRERLFIGRRKDGVLVYDVRRQKPVTTIANAVGANKAILVPEYNLGYTANEDGSTTVFRLSTLKTLKRIRFGTSADSGFYDPVTHQIMFTMGDSKALAFLDARGGAVLATLPMDSEKLEAAAPDGAGNFFLAERDKNTVVRVSAKQHEVTGAWPVAHCEEPTGLAVDTLHGRVFVGCRGQEPVLAILNADTGNTIATLPIGRGNDGVIYDQGTGMIYTSNGVDANLVVFRQLDSDTYKLVEASTTRPGARTMAFDPITKAIYLVTAEGAVDPSRRVLTSVAQFYPNKYFDNSFVVLTYTRH
jgi:DNA-binding beta-propeller fold protein YncE